MPPLNVVLDLWRPLSRPAAPHVTARRNEPCPCGSRRKYKRCCLETHAQAQELLRRARERRLLSLP